jgi:hypothetical protein
MKGSVIVVDLKKEDSAYAKREYGVTDAELDAFVKRMDAETRRDREAGKITRYTGDFKADIKK